MVNHQLKHFTYRSRKIFKSEFSMKSTFGKHSVFILHLHQNDEANIQLTIFTTLNHFTLWDWNAACAAMDIVWLLVMLENLNSDPIIASIYIFFFLVRYLAITKISIVIFITCNSLKAYKVPCVCRTMQKAHTHTAKPFIISFYVVNLLVHNIECDMIIFRAIFLQSILQCTK